MWMNLSGAGCKGEEPMTKPRGTLSVRWPCKGDKEWAFMGLGANWDDLSFLIFWWTLNTFRSVE